MTIAHTAEWLPIETAPRDGSQVIVLRGNRAEIASYYHRETYEFGKLVRTAKGWTSTHAVMGLKLDEPTHWLPLPELPR